MPKRKSIIPMERVEARIPAKLHAQMMLKLYSPLEEKIPYGAVNYYIAELIRKDLENGQNQTAVEAAG